jgi:hypothetical protein
MEMSVYKERRMLNDTRIELLILRDLIFLLDMLYLNTRWLAKKSTVVCLACRTQNMEPVLRPFGVNGKAAH